MTEFNRLFIFEMANNHQGDVNHGIAIIKEMGKIAKKFKLNAAVKLQYRQLDTFIHPAYRNDTKAKHISRFLSTELSKNEFLKMVQTIKAEGMLSMVTPFDEESVDVISEHNVDIIKIGSCSADDWPLLEKVASTTKPVIASTGGLYITQIDELVSFLSHRDFKFALLHCVGVYPSPNHILHLDYISKLISRYPNVSIGYSGHEAPDNYDVVKVAVAKGAQILERHVGLPTKEITLNNYSMNPDETEKWVDSALKAIEISGNIEKVLTQDEAKSLLSLKRGVFAKNPIKKGNKIKREDVFFAMPCKEGQLNSGQFGRIRAEYFASKDYDVNESIFEVDHPDSYYKVRKIIHQAKGLLSEAKIVLSNDAQIELNHHYGIESFDKYGILLVNLVNREYCKKIIVVFPGQEHPEQYHVKKEETFHILYGELEMSLNNLKSIAQKGDVITIERGVRHSFRSEKGAIFEEVSTTHYRNDSFYLDPKIDQQDPMQRKTVIDHF